MFYESMKEQKTAKRFISRLQNLTVYHFDLIKFPMKNKNRSLHWKGVLITNK